MTKKNKLQTGDVLIIIDVQNDFLPGGCLAVPGGDEVVPMLNRYIALFYEKALPIYVTRDWHPADHCSFKAQGGIWPPHCVQNTPGAEFANNLQLPTHTIVISKAIHQDQEAYSGFQDTVFDELLKNDNSQRLFMGGLATDYCVLNTVKDALKHHYQVYVLHDAIRAVNVQSADGEQAIKEMRKLGAEFIELSEMSEMLEIEA